MELVEMSLKLTALVTCKNERSNIGPCLDSLSPVADELLVADSGSTDGTLEFVRARGDCRVIERDYVTAIDFKNWAIPQANCPWVLILDADERLTAKLAAEIGKLKAAGPDADGYFIRRTNYLMGHAVRHTDWGRDRILRLFRRDLGRYAGNGDHGNVVMPGRRVGKLRHAIDHFTVWSWTEYQKKLDRYAQLQAEEWHAAGVRPSWRRMLMNPPLRFLRDVLLYRGFLDGMLGLQVAWSNAFYSFSKQARLWELAVGLRQGHPEADCSADVPNRVEFLELTPVIDVTTGACRLLPTEQLLVGA
jgi:glycosyltransferase involved in cell wall biosynthesis